MRKHLLFLAFLAACGGATPESPAVGPNVLLICIDTLRADHLGCYGAERDTSPNLDRLAARSIRFVDASATACWTKPSVPSFLTGTYPLQHGVYQGSARDEGGASSDVLPASAWTLAEAFSAAGYQTAAFVKNAQLRAGLGFEQGFDLYVDEAGDAREIRWQASDWLAERDPARPFFLYLHLLDAHWPYDIPTEAARRWASPGGVDFFRGDGARELRDAINGGELELTGEQRADLVALYDGAIRYVDGELGRLFAWLEREGVADDTLISVLSDHGEEFLEHGKIGHGHGLFENLLRVPWLLHVPGRPAQEVAGSVSLVDVFPTLLAAAGLPPAGAGATRLAGVDRLREPGRVVPILAEHLGKYDYQRSLRREAAKVVSTSEVDRSARYETRIDLVVGARYELKLEPSPEGAPEVTEVEEDDGEADDPLELKGRLVGLTAEGYRIAGIDVVLPSGVDVYGATQGSDGRRRGLEEGALVKASGRFEGGRFLAQKLKLYEPDAQVEEELRGPLTGIESDGLAIGGHELALAAGARLPESSQRPRMTRELARAIAQGALPEEPPLVTRVLAFDLALDPGELAGLPAPEGALGRELAERQRALCASPLWSPDDQAPLSEENLEALRALGYADDDDE